MTVHYTKRAVKDLERLPRTGQRRIVEAVDRFAMSGVGDVRTLTGQWRGRFRLRVGTLRVIFRMDDGINVIRVLHRREVYR